MVIARKTTKAGLAPQEMKITPKEVAEKILEKNIEDITALLCSPEANKSRIYEEVVEMVERALLRIALRRTNQIRSAAASYLGINRNTLQKKIVKLGIGDEPE